MQQCPFEVITLIVCGDIDCDLNHQDFQDNPRIQIFILALPDLQVIRNSFAYTYIHNSVTTSSFYFQLCCSGVTAVNPSHVDLSVMAADHFPVINSFVIDDPIPTSIRAVKKRQAKCNWKKVTYTSFTWNLT